MGSPGKATVTRAGYRAYINSPAWRAVRDRYWASQMPKNCYVCDCPRRPGMHLHHRTYKNLGNERLMDLAPVCPDCHDFIHAIYRGDPRWRMRGLWQCTKRARASYRKGNKQRDPGRVNRQ